MFIFGICSCSQVSGKLFIMEGNFFNSQGMYTEAISSYLKALQYPETVPYGEYGIGSVYLALDERNAALQRFAAAERALGALPLEEHRELAYRIQYNHGVIFFEGENFTGAVEKFRNALEIDSGRIEAKRNLELSLLSLSKTASSASAPADLSRERSGTEALFEYIRQKEQNQWKSREWIENTPAAGPDY